MACEGLDLSKLNRDEFVANNTTVWVKAQVLEKVYNAFGDYYTVIEFSDGCFNIFCEDQNGINQALLFFADSVLHGAPAAGGGQIISSAPSNGGGSGGGGGGGGAICGVPNIPSFEEAIKAVDSNAINQYGFQPAARMPNACAIPVKSNVKIYGPYASANFGQCGGTNAESDPDLCPWAFGSAALMNAAGSAKANSYPSNFPPQIETGSITVAEMPKLSLGGAFSGGGPNLTSVNVNFGSSGITTNYSFQTYTPKATGFTRLFIDRLKNISRYRQEQIKFLRNNNLDINKINRRLKIINNINNGGNNPRINARVDQNTAQRVLVGEIYDFHTDTSGQRTVVAMTTLPKAIQEMRYDFDKKAYMSLDGIFGPVSDQGTGGLPGYAAYSGLTDTPPCHRASPVSSHPPFMSGDNIDAAMEEYNLHIERKNLNPVSSPQANAYKGDSQDKSGHVIDITSRGEQAPEDGVINNFYFGDKAGNQYSGDCRFLSLRGPLVLHSWGFDTNGKPMPNGADSEEATKLGSFKQDKLKNEFLADWLQKPKTWPVAPVDLRFDRDRGVWVSPPSYKIVVAKLKEKLEPYGKAIGHIITKNNELEKTFSRPIYNKDGQEVKSGHDDSEASIIIVDRIGQSFDEDTNVYAYYDTHQCEYIVLSGNKESNIIRFKLIDICQEMVDPPVDDNWGDEWVSYAGYGDKFFDNNSFTDSYALRLNCNGEPINKKGEVLTSIDVDSIKEHLIVVRDVVGQWGPSFNRYDNDFDRWLKRAAEGYAVKIAPSGSGYGSGYGSGTDCDLRTPCLITYVDQESGQTKTIDQEYDILFLESYARFIHGCLEQDLYPVSGEEGYGYQDDEWKNSHPSGNALVKVEKFYGNADNGREPFYMDSKGEEIKVRVFDPWVSSSGEPISCYDPKQYQFWSATSGTPVVAAFNEKLKRYEIIEIGQKPQKAVRFKLYGCTKAEATTPNWGGDDDAWTAYAGFFDKIPNKHILGVRIDCDGNPVDRDGKILTADDITLENPDKHKIFINLFDTAGKFGPSFAGYKNFDHWKENASTGFGILCDIPPSGDCTMGVEGDCSSANLDPKFDSYDITYLESYARFIHGCLKQDLYVSQMVANIKYGNDVWKSTYPSGNAAVKIFKHYGGPDNEQEPKFWDNNVDEIDLRVFDPWVDATGKPLIIKNEPKSCYDPKKSPFYHAKEDTTFIAILNEKKKRYEIVQIGRKDETVIRFKLFDRCSSALAIPNYENGDAWTDEAGYKDKFLNNHILGVRIDCDGNPVDINGELIGDADLNDLGKASSIFVNLYDTAGKWGPGYATYNNDFNTWKDKASTGFAAKVSPEPNGCLGLGSNGQCNGPDEDLPSFDIIFMESYARFIHGCLKQDLYVDSNYASSNYGDDSYKTSHPSGNAAIDSNFKFYGDAPNGKKPEFYNSDGNEIPVRVFDPWLDEIDCYDPRQSQFYSATSGTPFTAVFNEQKKKYYLWSINESKTEIIRFRLIDTCQYSTDSYYGNGVDPANNDPWLQYAGYGDKWPNGHSLAVKINCDGLPVNEKNQIVTAAQMSEALNDVGGNLAKSIFINVFDTAGRFGPSNNNYKDYDSWITNGATGFAATCSPPLLGICTMGSIGGQCTDISSDYKNNYDILFLESYARFIECILDQDLYPTQQKVSAAYSDDLYKIARPLGNAAATISNDRFYGDSPNGKRPIFYDLQGEEVSIRVFDPYIEDPIERNPFISLKEGDRVLCVFNDKLKKYTIYSSLKDNESIVKFALVGDKGPADETVAGILVNHDNLPITIDNRSLIIDQAVFNANIITLRDPFSEGANLKARFGPALGSNLLNEHLNGINLNPECSENQQIYPFVGFALRKSRPIDEFGTMQSSYEILILERYAQIIVGKVASVTPDFDFNGSKYYLGLRTYHSDGVEPIARQTQSYGVPNILLDYDVLNFEGAHSYIVGKVIDGNADSCSDRVDGCRFKAVLDPSASSSSHLVYRITEAEHLALTGVSVIKKIELANELNADKINESIEESEIESEYFQGFMWDKIDNEDLYEEIEILNNPHWKNLPKITTGSRLHTTIVGIKPNGAPIYRIVSADTIATLGIRYLDSISTPGTFGHPNLPADDRKVDKDTDAYCQGVTPEIIDNDNEKPLWKLSPNPAIGGIETQQWMTFKQSRVLGLWIDRNGPNIKDGYYAIAHAQEAPVIITCKAKEEFKPNQLNGISVEVGQDTHTSSQGHDKDPLVGGANLLNKVKNPMGYGAKVGDFVTIQRVWSNVVENDANYYYIVIGTGSPPGALK